MAQGSSTAFTFSVIVTKIRMWWAMTHLIGKWLFLLYAGFVFLYTSYYIYVDFATLILSVKVVIAQYLLHWAAQWNMPGLVNFNMDIRWRGLVYRDVAAVSIATGDQLVELKDHYLMVIVPTCIAAAKQAGLWGASIFFLYPAVMIYLNKLEAGKGFIEHIKGSRLITEAQLYFEMKKNDHLPVTPMGGINMPRELETRHLIVVGRPGTGKTTDLYQKLAAIRDRGERCILHDPKGDYIRKFYRRDRDIILNPVDSRFCKGQGGGWNIFNEVHSRMDIDSICAALIPLSTKADSFFPKGARGLLRGNFLACWDKGMRTTKELFLQCAKDLPEQEAFMQGIPGCEEALGYIAKGNGAMPGNVKAVLLQHISSFEWMVDGDFSLTQWARDEDADSWIFLSNQADIRDTLKPILSMAVSLVGLRLLSLPENINRRVHIICDELAQLQQLDPLLSFLEQGRSHGLAVDLRFQALSSIVRIYGPQTAEAILDSCGNSAIYAVSDPGAAKAFSNRIGEHKFRQRKMAWSGRIGESGDGATENFEEKTEPLIMPAEIQNLPDFWCYCRVSGYDWVLSKVKRKDFPDIEEAFEMRADFSMDKIVEIKAQHDYLTRMAARSAIDNATDYIPVPSEVDAHEAQEEAKYGEREIQPGGTDLLGIEDSMNDGQTFGK